MAETRITLKSKATELLDRISLRTGCTSFEVVRNAINLYAAAIDLAPNEELAILRTDEAGMVSKRPVRPK